MKTKFYFFLFAGLFAFAADSNAQCTVAINSLIVNGMSVSASASGVGNQFPYYEWFWDDSTANTVTPNSYAQHTYAQTGGYQVCVTYTDSANPFSCVTSDCDSLYIGTANGTAEIGAIKSSVRISPNPVTDNAIITIALRQESDVVITLFDLTGKEMGIMEEGKLQAGLHVITWSTKDLPEGVYFLQIKTGNIVQSKKVIRTSGN